MALENMTLPEVNAFHDGELAGMVQFLMFAQRYVEVHRAIGPSGPKYDTALLRAHVALANAINEIRIAIKYRPKTQEVTQ